MSWYGMVCNVRETKSPWKSKMQFSLQLRLSCCCCCVCWQLKLLLDEPVLLLYFPIAHGIILNWSFDTIFYKVRWEFNTHAQRKRESGRRRGEMFRFFFSHFLFSSLQSECYGSWTVRVVIITRWAILCFHLNYIRIRNSIGVMHFK